MKDDKYYFHQTPIELAVKLISTVPFEEGDRVLEPFKGEGSFYNNFPDNVIKEWTEIEEGRDYLSHTTEVDWVITNPPFKLGDRVSGENAIWTLLKHYTKIACKGICFLVNDYGLSTITPKRMKELNALGWYVKGYIVLNVKAWRGRYFFMTFTKEENKNISFLESNY